MTTTRPGTVPPTTGFFRLMLMAVLLAGPMAITSQAADDPPEDEAGEAKDRQRRIVLEEPAQTVDEALERLSQQESEAANELEAAQKTFDDRMAGATQQTVNDLQVIARRAIADGQLADAAEAWTHVLRLDPENREAERFFETIGRPEVAEEKKSLASIRKDLLGTWKWQSGTEITFKGDGSTIAKTENRIRRGGWRYDPKEQAIIFLDPSGKATDLVKITRGGRMLEGTNHKKGYVWGVKIE